MFVRKNPFNSIRLLREHENLIRENEALNETIKEDNEQIEELKTRNEMLEECLIELANIIYA